jgi:trehalose 6-phosphate synthase
MLAYDLIGFQTDDDRHNFEEYLRHEFGMSVADGAVASAYGLTQLATFPIGIDVDEFASRATKAITRPDVARLRASLEGAKLALGVDRLDYSKGLPNRIRAFDRMLDLHTELKRGVSLLQVAVPSRGNIRAYRELKADLASLVGEVNGRHGEVDWSPIRYLNKGFAQSTLAGFYRVADVGLVTPLHDGMNLVAKEYVAAQNPFDPGVLVLSSFAGAAKELDAALLVNPHDIDGMARQIANAFVMSLEERRERWHTLVATLRRSSVQNWFANFLQALTDPRRTTPRLAASRSSAAPILVDVGGTARTAQGF